MTKKVIKKETVSPLFIDKVCNAKPGSFKAIKKEGFDCLLQMFVQTNVINGKVLLEGTNMSGGESDDFVSTVPPSELIGIQVLWQLFEESGKSDKEMIQKAINILNKTYTSYSCELESRAKEFGLEFVTQTIRRLKDYLEREQVQEQKTTMTKLTVEMLKNFFQHSEQNGNMGIIPYQAVDRGIFLKDVVIDLNMSAKNNTAKCIELSVYQAMSVWDIKKLVAEKTDVSPLQITFNRQGKLLAGTQSNACMIGELGVCPLEKVQANKI
jgi:hypothetical protein